MEFTTIRFPEQDVRGIIEVIDDNLEQGYHIEYYDECFEYIAKYYIEKLNLLFTSLGLSTSQPIIKLVKLDRNFAYYFRLFIIWVEVPKHLVEEFQLVQKLDNYQMLAHNLYYCNEVDITNVANFTQCLTSICPSSTIQRIIDKVWSTSLELLGVENKREMLVDQITKHFIDSPKEIQQFVAYDNDIFDW